MKKNYILGFLSDKDGNKVGVPVKFMNQMCIRDSLVHVKYAGLPNLLLNREVTPELLQDAVTPEHIVEIAGAWITDETKRQQNIQELKEVRSKLGDSGAVRRTGELILNTARIGKE